MQIGIFADNESDVIEATDKIEKFLNEGIDGMANVRSTLTFPRIDWKVEVDKQKAAQLGVNIVDIGALVQMLTNGFKVGEYRPDDSRDEVEIRVRFEREQRSLTLSLIHI